MSVVASKSGSVPSFSLGAIPNDQELLAMARFDKHYRQEKAGSQVIYRAVRDGTALPLPLQSYIILLRQAYQDTFAQKALGGSFIKRKKIIAKINGVAESLAVNANEKNGAKRLKIFRIFPQEKLNEGAFGEVFGGVMLTSSQLTAVKSLNAPPRNGNPCHNLVKLHSLIEQDRENLRKALPLAFKTFKKGDAEKVKVVVLMGIPLFWNGCEIHMHRYEKIDYEKLTPQELFKVAHNTFLGMLLIRSVGFVNCDLKEDHVMLYNGEPLIIDLDDIIELKAMPPARVINSPLYRHSISERKQNQIRMFCRCLSDANSLKENLKHIEKVDPDLFHEIDDLLRKNDDKQITAKELVNLAKRQICKVLRQYLIDLHNFSLGITLMRILLPSVRNLKDGDLRPYVQRENIPNLLKPGSSLSTIIGLNWPEVYKRYIKDSPSYIHMSPTLQSLFYDIIHAEKSLEPKILPLLSFFKANMNKAKGAEACFGESQEQQIPSDEEDNV